MTILRPPWLDDGSEIPDPFGYGERAVTWLRTLRHPKSKLPRKQFQLDPWQERIVRKIYGPRNADGSRIVREVIMMVPRGARKTSLSAALSLLHTIGPEHEPGSEVVFAACDKEQAAIAFRESLGIVRADPRIEKAMRVSDAHNAPKLLQYKKDGTFLKTLSSDASKQHGGTPIFSLIDELHAWPKRDLFDVLESSRNKIDGTLAIILTTAGRGQENIAYEKISYARKVASGEVDDPATLPILFEAPRDCDWTDEAIWRAVNPGLDHGYPSLKSLRNMVVKAKEQPAVREIFRQLHLNIWLDYSADPFVDMHVYDEGAQPVDLEALAHQPCWLGVDLSSNSDLTAVVACWRDDDDGYIVHPWFFCPRDNLQRRADRDGVPYPLWAEQGFIEPTPGNVIDFRIVEARIRELCERFEVREIAFDPHLARNILNNLLEDGYPAVEMQQGWKTMSKAIDELERAILGHKLCHGGHPVLRWNFENIAIQVIDASGNRKFHKGKSRDRIDGAQATAMAVGRAYEGSSDRSPLENPSITADDWIRAVT